MNVWVWGGPASTARAREDGIDVAVSRDAFFSETDVLSLHIRLSEQSRGIVTLSDLKKMKPSALVVNTSRAELIETGALEAALKIGTPGFAAVDVYDDEPLAGAGHPLVQLPNVLCTPHLGYVERDNYENYFGTAFDNINNFAAGKATNLV
jgi:D-3-phosphoglycerate dehydrogenase